MKDHIIKFMDMWKADYQFKILFSSLLSLLIGFGFTLFNGALGIVYGSMWNGSICIYYVLLTIVRGTFVNLQKSSDEKHLQRENQKNKRVYVITHIVLIAADLALIGPIAIMVRGGRSYTYGLIPAIAMAAYTTYRVTIGIIHFKKSRKEDNIFVKELRLINLQDSLVSLLTLQNALIIASGDGMQSMVRLTAWTSGSIWIVIVFFTVKSFLAIKSGMYEFRFISLHIF